MSISPFCFPHCFSHRRFNSLTNSSPPTLCPFILLSSQVPRSWRICRLSSSLDFCRRTWCHHRPSKHLSTYCSSCMGRMRLLPPFRHCNFHPHPPTVPHKSHAPPRHRSPRRPHDGSHWNRRHEVAYGTSVRIWGSLPVAFTTAR